MWPDRVSNPGPLALEPDSSKGVVFPLRVDPVLEEPSRQNEANRKPQHFFSQKSTKAFSCTSICTSICPTQQAHDVVTTTY